MDKLIGNDSFSEESGDSKHALETKLDLYAFEDIVGSISKTRRERKIDANSIINDDVFEHDGDQLDLNTNVDHEWETDVEEVETSDWEWATDRAKVAECKR